MNVHTYTQFPRLYQICYNIPMKPRNITPHAIILAAIILIFGAGVIILLRWDKGIPSDYDPSQVSTDFETEALDFIMPPDEAWQARANDGPLNILCLGNNPFSDERGAYGLAEQIGTLTGATVYNGAFPDTTIATRRSSEKATDYLSLYFVTMALINRKYNYLESGVALSENPATVAALDVLRGLNMKEMDIIVIMYDSTDYNERSPADNPSDAHDIYAYTGALRTSLEAIRQYLPHIRVIFMSHTYARYLDENGTLHNGATYDLGNGTLPHYLILGQDTAIVSGVSFMDHYFGSIHEGNYADYMSDHMHLNAAGRGLLAERVAAVIAD